MNNAAAQRTVRLEPALRAIADMTRLKILLMLEGRERTVNEIVSFFGLAQPTITRHLQTLTAAGLLSRRKEGARVFYGTHVLKVGSVCMDLAKCFPCCCVAVEATPKNSTTRPRSRKSSKPAARKTAKKATKKISRSAPRKPTKTQTRRSR
jgi:DNA-binding transcriptional ArsR family regulator